jgi:hypothetical protein
MNPLFLLTAHSKKKSGLIVLGHVGLLHGLLRAAIFGPMAGPAAPLAGVTASGLARSSASSCVAVPAAGVGVAATTASRLAPPLASAAGAGTSSTSATELRLVLL